MVLRMLSVLMLFAATLMATATASNHGVDGDVRLDVLAGIARASTPLHPFSPSPDLPQALADYVVGLHKHVREPRTASGSPGTSTQQDCMAYALAYSYALQLQPSRAPQRHVWDALRLGPDCGASPPPSREELGLAAPWPHVPTVREAAEAEAARSSRNGAAAFFVSPQGNDAADGSEAHPFATISRGVAATRTARAPGSGPASVTLRAGIHTLNATIILDERDSGLTIQGFPGEAAWVSGGAALGPGLRWQKVTPSPLQPNATNVYSATLDSPPAFLTGLVGVAPDGSPNKRLFRAQYPNYNPELHVTGACGGASSRHGEDRPECVRLFSESPFLQDVAKRLAHAGLPRHTAAGPGSAPKDGGIDGFLRDPAVSVWEKPDIFPHPPQTFFRNLSGLGLKSDSTMAEYNLFSTGRGGACGLWTNAWPENHTFGWDYHCGNVSAGGWEEVDELMHTEGHLNIPVGVAFNLSVLPRAADWRPNVDPAQRINGAAVVNVWMTQYWFNNWLYVTGKGAAEGAFSLQEPGTGYPAGGWQGGRHWQTSGSFAHPQTDGGDLLGGAWSIINVFEELDAYDEFYYDVDSRTLYVYYNASSDGQGDPAQPPPTDLVLMAPQLEVLFNITGGASDVTLSSLGFRDQRAAMLDPWMVPSGGDWGLRPAGAVNILAPAQRITLQHSLFLRTDANAVYIEGGTRNVTVDDVEFAYLGMTGVATQGLSDQDDASRGEQPWGTVLSGIVWREGGVVEKQSSAWFAARFALSRMENSIMFNGPRAMINLQDPAGGGANITRTLQFNSCRESGDHGSMNSWNRMPLASRVASKGGAPTFDNLHTETSRNMIIANYGSSQGFDNDDGSSWYYTTHNFFYQADGFKNDYGGHNSIFANNVIAVRNYDGQQCINAADFVSQTTADLLTNNTCVIMPRPKPNADLVITGSGGWCEAPGSQYTAQINANRYYTTHGNASVACGRSDYGVTIAAWQKKWAQFENNSKWDVLPPPETLIQWGRDVLGI